MQKLGVADYPDKELLETLWKSGLRAQAILEYLEENGLPAVSATALAKYGQRNWNDKKVVVVEEDFESESLWAISDIVSDVEKSSLGSVERISISKTGYSVSVKPHPVMDSVAEIQNLSRMPSEGYRRPYNESSPSSGPSTHIIIPDTQIEPGRPYDHLHWAGLFIRDNFSLTENVKIIHLGDHWNMGALSSYDKGKGSMEGRRYLADIEEGNKAFRLLNYELEAFKEKHFLFGNHCDRVNKAINSDIQLEGLLTTDHMLTPGWERHGFLEPVFLDGIGYSHYWYNPNTGKPYGGVCSTRLKTIGHSFVMGHQQGLDWAHRYIGGQQQFGLVAGSFYLHEEDYKGPQGNDHWQGIVVLHDVENGSCESPEFVSMERLCQMYEGKSLQEWKDICL